MIRYLACVLERLDTTSSSVQRITIIITVSDECNLYEWEGKERWDALETAFSRLTSTSLREVKIQVRSNEGCTDEITGLDVVEKGLPGLLSRGILKVEKIQGKQTNRVFNPHDV